MNTRDEPMAEWMERYFEELETNPNAEPPREMDSQMIETIKKMNAYFAAPEPNAEFVASLRDTLARQANQGAPAQKTARTFFALQPWSFVGISAALLAAIVAIGLWVTQPAPVDASMVLNKARDAANNFSAVGVNTFEMTTESEQAILGDPQQPITGMSFSTSKIYYGSPLRWRVETTDETLNTPRTTNINVQDGATNWTYDAFNNLVLADVPSQVGLPLPNVGSLELLNQDVSQCWTPRVLGEESIAGRAAYMIDLGNNKCRSAALAAFHNARRKLWVDKETFFVLRDEIKTQDGAQNLDTYVVREIRYNIPLDDTLFQFTPPQGSKLNDMRPKPAPNAQEFLQQLQQLEKQSDVKLYTPRAIPNGLVPRTPRYDPLDNTVKLEYVPLADASTNTFADLSGITILETQATDEKIEMWTQGSEPSGISRYRTWTRKGDYNPNTNEGSNSAVYLVIDDTFVVVSSYIVSVDDLLKTALSLERITP